MTFPPNRSRGPLFTQQLLSTLKLNLLQRVRSPASSIVGIIIPIVFILGTVLISKAIKDQQYEGKSFLDYQRTYSSIVEQKLILASLCYDFSLSGMMIDGLQSCDAVAVLCIVLARITVCRLMEYAFMWQINVSFKFGSRFFPSLWQRLGTYSIV
ncbi:putative ABC transporter [Trypanosoma cruzi]|uniref:Putative ABC transporter n=1 Tax=Trypanosoma cruzi TaxID=5693 RepID=A0A2V2V3S1_TRYCR|nr:putative ABC transporter [Trypanosoma cruzi]